MSDTSPVSPLVWLAVSAVPGPLVAWLGGPEPSSAGLP